MGHSDNPLSGPVQVHPRCGESSTDRRGSATAKTVDCCSSGKTGRSVQSLGSTTSTGTPPLTADERSNWTAGSQYPERVPVRGTAASPAPGSGSALGAGACVLGSGGSIGV